MNQLLVKINGVEYPLATTLRAAYAVQARFDRKPYMEIFSGLGTMDLEDQIVIMYVCFKTANPDSTITEKEFIDFVLDSYHVADLMELEGELVMQIMYGGLSPEEIKAKNLKARQMKEAIQ